MCRRSSLQCRREQTEWERSVPELLAADDMGITWLLIQDGLLPKMEGVLGKVQLRDSGLPRHRCFNRTQFQCFVIPHHLHPLFTATRGAQGHSLQVQSVALLLMVSNVSLSTIHILTKINHKALDFMWKSVAFLRKHFVEAKEKEIQFGKAGRRQDIEADEATFDKMMTGSLAHWEQWAGIVTRGCPESLVLMRLKPPPTTCRAPGPDAIRKIDWKPIAGKWLKDRNVILHTDSAGSYKAKVPGVLHDSVAHQKKRVKVKGKYVWQPPIFVKLTTHKLPCGKKSCQGRNPDH